MGRMKITDVRCSVAAVPRPGGGAHRNWVFVHVDTDAGLQGAGEAPPDHHAHPPLPPPPSTPPTPPFFLKHKTAYARLP